MSGTAITDTGDAAPRVTEHHHYPLPPFPPDRFVPQHGQYGWYRLPSPTTGLASGYPRATSLASLLDDTYGLDKWQKRNVLIGLATDVTLIAAVLEALENGTKAAELDDICEAAQVAAGAAEAREFGTAIHAWCEAIDQGRVLFCEVPEMFQPHVREYLLGLARNALVAIPEFTERIVFNKHAGTVGTLDRIFWCAADDKLRLGDIKSSKDLAFGYLSGAIQLCEYAEADLMLSLDGKTWEPMPEIEKDYAILMHCPSDAPERSAAIPFDLAAGRRGLDLALAVKAARKSAKADITGKHTFAIPDATTYRQHLAVVTIRLSESVDELAAVWDEYQDVWSDELTTLGGAVAEALQQKEVTAS